MERREKLLNIIILGPLLLAPVLAVEFPRILAYLPILIGVLGGVTLWCTHRETPKFTKPLLVFLAGFIALAAVSLLWSAQFEESFERFQKLMLLIPLYVLAIAVINRAAPRLNSKFLLVLMISCAIGAALTAFDISMDSIIHRTIRGIPDSEDFNTAVFNRGAVSITFLGLMAFFLRGGQFDRVSAIMLITITVMMGLIQSQSAQLAAVLGLLFFYLFPFKQRWAWIGLFVLTAIFILAKPFLTQYLDANMPEWFYELPFMSAGYLWHRMEIWAFAADQSFANLWLGQGLEATKTIDHAFSVGPPSILHPHSITMQIWIEFGLLGIMAFIAALGWLFKTLHDCPDETLRRASLTSFVIIFAVANVSYGMWQSWWLGLLCLVVCVFVACMKQKAVV